jgi:hypothetical protein
VSSGSGRFVLLCTKIGPYRGVGGNGQSVAKVARKRDGKENEMEGTMELYRVFQSVLSKRLISVWKSILYGGVKVRRNLQTVEDS